MTCAAPDDRHLPTDVARDLVCSRALHADGRVGGKHFADSTDT
jgi:hypothetical protein